MKDKSDDKMAGKTWNGAKSERSRLKMKNDAMSKIRETRRKSKNQKYITVWSRHKNLLSVEKTHIQVRNQRKWGNESLNDHVAN